MVDGDEEVDTILFEFKVSVVCVDCLLASSALFFWICEDLQNLSGVVRGQKLSGNLGEMRKKLVIWIHGGVTMTRSLRIVTVTLRGFA
jgi:hypothetical protein